MSEKFNFIGNANGQGKYVPEKPGDDHCVVPVVIEGSKKEVAQMSHIINQMCRSDAGREVIETALKNNYTFMFDTSVPDAYGYADPESRVCAMNPRFGESDLITTMAHELRHVHQFETSVAKECIPETADTKSNLMLSKIMEADAEAYGCFVSWELKQQGKDGPWHNFKRDFPEIVKPFEKALQENEGKPDAMDKARTAAFYGWFDNTERRIGYDDSHVDILRDIGAKNLAKKLESYDVADMVKQICSEKGRVYFADDPKKVDSEKYVAVDQMTKNRLNIFFNGFYKKGGKRDKSLDTMPVMGGPSLSFSPRAVSASAKRAALDARQEKSADLLKNRKTEQAFSLAALKKKALSR